MAHTGRDGAGGEDESERSTTVRLIGPEDWELLRAARLRALADAPSAFRSTLGEAEARPATFWREQAGGHLGPDACATAVALTGDQAVGMATAVESGHEVELVQVWVARDRRREGVLRALIEALEPWVAGRILRAEVFPSNEAAVSAFSRLGFVDDRRPGVAHPLLFVRQSSPHA